MRIKIKKNSEIKEKTNVKRIKVRKPVNVLYPHYDNVVSINFVNSKQVKHN
jgi:hypothetical protein